MGSSQWTAERQELLNAAHEMCQDGLVLGSSGNVSLRIRDNERELIAITASSIPYASMELDHIVVIDHDGEPIVGDYIPSSELFMHSAIYRARDDVKSIMHTHSVFASALAVSGMKIPAILDEMVIAMGDEVAVTEYAHPSSEELGIEVVKALDERSAVLIKNHGFLGVGKTPNEALNICKLGEHVSKILFYSHMLGKVDKIPESIVNAELEIFRMRKLSG